MTRFYRMLAQSESATFDPVRAAELEVEWWRVHREHQHGGPDDPVDPLVAALRDLYAYTYTADPEAVRPAAELRARAMDVSDAWVDAGRDPEDGRLAEEGMLLVRSYAVLLATVHR